MTHIVTTIVLGLLSINAFTFLKTYLTLFLFGSKTNGLVIAFELSNSIVTKNALIPKIEFLTNEGKIITGKPMYSWSIELCNYQVHKNYTVIYNKSNPNKFVVKSNVELATNFVLLAGALTSLITLLVKFV